MASADCSSLYYERRLSSQEVGKEEQRAAVREVGLRIRPGSGDHDNNIKTSSTYNKDRMSILKEGGERN